MLESYTFKPIGEIHSPLKNIGDAPRQGDFINDKVVLEIIIEPEFIEGITNLVPGDIVDVIFCIDRYMNQGNNEVKHAFSSRSPKRPNPIGVTSVKILERNENSLKIVGGDMLDGTPVLDIKISMMRKIRLAESWDIDKIMGIYADARKFMKRAGNASQWRDGYPQRELIEKDMINGNLYICTNGGRLEGVFAAIKGEEKCYNNIYDGHWSSDREYVTVHRIASAIANEGVGEFCLRWCSRKFGYVRLDTHENNYPMQKLLHRTGFKKCGKVIIHNGTERIAYDK